MAEVEVKSRRASRLSRRALLVGASAGIGSLVGRQCGPTNHPAPSYPPLPATASASSVVLNDASLLSPTPVASHITIRDAREATLEKMRASLNEAKAARRPFVASAARHSMGGQSLAANGTVVTLDQDWLEPDTAAKTYRVGAGVRWSTVIAKLDA